jgi:hypothetical protein
MNRSNCKKSKIGKHDRTYRYNLPALTGAVALHLSVQHSQIFNSIGGRHCISHCYAVAAASRRDPGDTMILFFNTHSLGEDFIYPRPQVRSV